MDQSLLVELARDRMEGTNRLRHDGAFATRAALSAPADPLNGNYPIGNLSHYGGGLNLVELPDDGH